MRAVPFGSPCVLCSTFVHMSSSRHKSFLVALQTCVSRLELQLAQAVFRAGTLPRYIHFLEEGAVRLVRHGRQGEEEVLHDARPGELLGQELARKRALPLRCDCVTAERYPARRAAFAVQCRRSNSASAALRGARCELEITGSLKDLERLLGLTHESLYRTLARM